MTTFTLKANIQFTAENLDDAFSQLGKHFFGLIACGSEFEFTGNLSINAKEEQEVGPEFAAELERFYFNLADKQEALGDPFGKILAEAAWDLYTTGEK